MDKTPKGKSLRFVKEADSSFNDISNFTSCSSSTPVKGTKKPKIWDESDNCNQGNNLDVVWDWDSPKNIKPKISRTRKKETSKKSPKVKPQRTTSQINQIKNFEKLREELQALRNEIAKVDDDCLPLSPLDEQSIKDDEINQFIEEQYYHIENQENKTEHIPLKSNDWLDVSCDEQLFLCSQMIEEKLNTENNKSKKNDISIRETIPYSNSKEISIDDSFDAIMQEFKDEDIEFLTQSNTNTPSSKFRNSHSNLTFKRTHSDANVEYVKPDTKPINIQRTLSFESSTNNLPNHVIEEIERKRQEALEKLKKKKIESSTIVDLCNNIPCSSKEIEKKRLQAKAIREAKQKEIIEKNRKEALKRLEMNKLKRMDLNRNKN